ncbi:putative dehydrogenase [Salinibacterium amurskyense]|uniref:Putative dehydrogenase n=1 Tax=Salinibacterium amurskyense TaxID=205941 RepID=A0A2M9D9Y8_9MICO|nr:Gfo/Idh/MocA family oxidoreductase [Salinibacterium amurskyense]PJJ82546.1 putative dehydrogenase [Salinibacterium amurskyense]RLQ82286.1 gfo/Idh/MocA family oxidoreductase [Salinibacterium amurskyense]GHD76564.1 hypothetical protein GCM10007394_00840 [Salinibacterium amurskyense]
MSARRVLVVGAGVMGHRHAVAVRAVGDQIAAVVDTDLARASAVDSGASTYTSVQEALAQEHDLDSAIIATPSAGHLVQSTELVAAGLDVLVEKPHRVPGQDPALLRDALRTGGRLFVGMSTRHWAGVKAVVSAVADGELGEILTYNDRMQFHLEEDSLPGWYFNSAVSGGGVLVTNGVHAFDRARAILGEELQFHTAALKRVNPSHETEDHASVIARVGESTIASIDMSWVPFDPIGTGLIVMGTRGTARIYMDGSWSISAIGVERSGPSINIDRAPFISQWTSFRDEEAGFGLDDLEPTLELIEQIYQEVPVV